MIKKERESSQQKYQGQIYYPIPILFLFITSKYNLPCALKIILHFYQNMNVFNNITQYLKQLRFFKFNQFLAGRDC